MPVLAPVLAVWLGCCLAATAGDDAWPPQVPASFRRVLAADFEGVAKADGHRLDWPVPHWFEFAARHREDGGKGNGEGGARMWVESGKARSGKRCIGLELKDIARSRRAEFAVFLDDVVADEYFLSYWLQVDTDWGLHHPQGKDWYEIGNPCSAGGAPYAAIWLSAPDADQATYSLELGGRDAAGKPYHAGKHRGINLPRERWFQVVAHVRLDPSNGMVRVWWDGALVGEAVGVPTRPAAGGARKQASIAKIYHDRADRVPKRIWVDDLSVYVPAAQAAGAPILPGEGSDAVGASSEDAPFLPLDMAPGAWRKAYFHDGEPSAPEAMRRLTAYEDAVHGPVLTVGPWYHGQWSLRWDHGAAIPVPAFTLRGMYRTEDCLPGETLLRVEYLREGRSLAKRDWQQWGVPTDGQWRPFRIDRPLPWPGADAVRIGLGLSTHTGGRLHFARLEIRPCPDPAQAYGEPPVAAPLRRRDLAFLSGKPSDRYRLEGQGEIWTLVAPDGSPFYSIGSMAPWDEMSPSRQVALIKDLQDKGYNSIAAWMGLRRFVGADALRTLAAAGVAPMPIFHTLESYGDERRIHPFLLRDAHGQPNSGEIRHAFPDPFDPGFRAYYREMVAREMAVAEGNPHLVAWMQDNELSHANLFRCVFSEHAGRRFVAFLKERHGGDIARLNRAWGTRFANFAEILAARHVPVASVGADFDDYFAFSREVVAAYARLSLDVFRELDPGRLVFSNRFMHEPETLRYADLYAGFDAIALNLYPANFTYGLCPEERAFIEALHRRTGRPLMITEWSIPAADSGLYGARDKLPMDWSWNELVPDQAIRAAQAASVARELHALPFVIGAHWFQYMDVASAARQANRGIFHADKVTPWHELTAAMREAHHDILQTHGTSPVGPGTRQEPACR